MAILVAGAAGHKVWAGRALGLCSSPSPYFSKQQEQETPRDAQAFWKRGQTWEQKKDWDRAIADYSEAIRLDPQNTSFYWARSNAWFQKRDHDQALRDINEAIRLKPKAPDLLYARAYYWNAKQDVDKALAGFSEVIQLDPKSFNSYAMRGKLWLKKRHLLTTEHLGRTVVPAVPRRRTAGPGPEPQQSVLPGASDFGSISTCSGDSRSGSEIVYKQCQETGTFARFWASGDPAAREG